MVCRKRNPHGGTYIAAATVENSIKVPQKTKKTTAIRPNNSTPRYLSKKDTNTK